MSCKKIRDGVTLFAIDKDYETMEMILVGRKLTTHEAAEMLGVSIRAVQALIKRGTLKAERFGQIWQLDEDDVQAMIDNRRKGRKWHGNDNDIQT